MDNTDTAPECAYSAGMSSAALSVPALASAAGLTLQLVSSAADLRRITPQLNLFLERCHGSSWALHVPDLLDARRPSPNWAQRVVVARAEGRLEAAIFLREQTFLGLPTGYFRGGDAFGHAIVLCKGRAEEHLLAVALEHLLRRHRAFLILLDRPANLLKPPHLGRHRCNTDVSTVAHWQHPLRSTFDATLAPFGHRTRRNLRYALRRVEKNQWQFFPTLNAPQLASAVEELATTSTHPFPDPVAAARMASIATTPGSFAMGLSDAGGRWLSCLAGRRMDGATEILWQSNARGYGGDSLCTAMRALLMREEVARRSATIRYIGGACPLMQHCCSPELTRQTTLGRRGLRHGLVRLLARLPVLSRTHPLSAHLREQQAGSRKSKRKAPA